MSFLKDTPAGKRVTIRHQIRKRFIRDGVLRPTDDLLNSYGLNELRRFRKAYNAY